MGAIVDPLFEMTVVEDLPGDTSGWTEELEDLFPGLAAVKALNQGRLRPLLRRLAGAEPNGKKPTKAESHGSHTSLSLRRRHEAAQLAAGGKVPQPRDQPIPEPGGIE